MNYYPRQMNSNYKRNKWFFFFSLIENDLQRRIGKYEPTTTTRAAAYFFTFLSGENLKCR